MNPQEVVTPPEALLAVPTNYRSYATDGTAVDLDEPTSTSPNESEPMEKGCARDVVFEDAEEAIAPPKVKAEEPEGSFSTPPNELEPVDEGCARDVVFEDASETALPKVVADNPKDGSLEPVRLGLPASAGRSGGSHGLEDKGVLKSPGKSPLALSKDDIDAVFPDDIVKPNPAFGDSSDPISQKIGVLNEDSMEKTDNSLHAGESEAEVKTIPE